MSVMWLKSHPAYTIETHEKFSKNILINTIFD